jgi:hypothetical protein
MVRPVECDAKSAQARDEMRTYAVVANCPTGRCRGGLHFGSAVAKNNDALAKQLRSYGDIEAQCPVCQTVSRYTSDDYYAVLLPD